MKKLIASAILAAVALAGAAVPASASESAKPADVKYSLKQRADGGVDTFKNGVKVADGRQSASKVQAGYNPLQSWKFKRGLLCVWDYTPESAVSWDPNRSTDEWSKANELHIYWDDKNGGGDNCGTYDLTERINLYSYGDASDPYCSQTDVSVSGVDGMTVLSATVWLNRLADNHSCRQTFTLRQNIVTAGIGNALGLAYHTNGNISVMCAWLTYRLAYAYPYASDFEAVSRRY